MWETVGDLSVTWSLMEGPTAPLADVESLSASTIDVLETLRKILKYYKPLQKMAKVLTSLKQIGKYPEAVPKKSEFLEHFEMMVQLL